ncbi:hypothetical protein GC194_07730 [bacterium]|nr:hypothetical protein [bacterium]
MKPKLIHKSAIEFSFKAQQSLQSGDFAKSHEYFKEAAALESQVAEFYLERTDLEPTRSLMIRSAAFLNLKAGLIENAQRFIFFGLLHLKNEAVRNELQDALEMSVSLRNEVETNAGLEFNYLNILRQRSIHYVLEPANLRNGHSVSLEMINDFSGNYLKSLKAFALAKLNKIYNVTDEAFENFAQNIQSIINPLVTNTSYGSFKFSIANDYLARQDEDVNLVRFKSNVIPNFHKEIFTNPLTDKEINELKSTYDDDAINEMFRPLVKIKSTRSDLKVSYYDKETLSKVSIPKIVNKQRKQLLTTRKLTQDEIGELESNIIHKRSSSSGKVHKQTILKEQLKAYEFDISTNQIVPSKHNPIILREDISINVKFDSENGFIAVFDDLNLSYSDTEYQKSLTGLYDKFYSKILILKRKNELTIDDENDLRIVKDLIINIDAIE